MTAKRSALGRGLGALIPGASNGDTEARRQRPLAETPRSSRNAPPVSEERDEAGRYLTQLPVASIDPNPEQPRRHFDPAELADMAKSVRTHGVLQPVVVRQSGDRYELIMGERRWRASREAGLETIPAVVADVEPSDRLELAIVENVQRQDLNPMELAHAYRALATAGATQDEIGARVSKDRSSIANHMRLLELSRDIQEDVESARITMGHAKALLQVVEVDHRARLRDRVVRDQLSVRATELLARQISGPGTARKTRRTQKAGVPIDPDVQLLLERIEKNLQTRVRLTGTADRGKIEIEYYSAEDLDRLSEVLLGSL